MKFVGKTSVAVIKSAILGALQISFFFCIEGRESRNMCAGRREKKVPVHRWDP